MTETRELVLPKDAFRLEERNLPESLAPDLAGKTTKVKVLPEETALTRQVGPDDYPLLIDPQGNYWNDYRPVRVLYADSEGREWRLPRAWLSESPVGSEVPLESSCAVLQETAFSETMNLPSEWDLWEINLPWEVVAEAHRMRPALVEVRYSPGEPATVSWRDRNGTVWRIPHDWRKRRVKLPEFDMLVSQGIAEDVAEEYAGKIVSVNYHPGTLCCLPDQYRFRDDDGGKWPVRIEDCVIVGYGDTEEHLT